MRILLCDDERSLLDAVSTILKQNKFEVDTARDGEEGYDFITSGIYDLIILDIMMPKMDGITLLKKIRREGINTPVLMLSAKGQTFDKVDGLNAGADDYLSKPFNSNELLARIKALLRRKENFTSDELSFSDITLNRDTYEIICKESKLPLGKKEFQLMEQLILNKGKAMDKERLIEKIWGFDSDAEYNAIEVYISFLRRKINAIGSSVEIKSIRGIGYVLGEKND